MSALGWMTASLLSHSSRLAWVGWELFEFQSLKNFVSLSLSLPFPL